MTYFAAVLYVGRHKVAEAKRTYLHVFIHSAANSAEDARCNCPATGEGKNFNPDPQGSVLFFKLEHSVISLTWKGKGWVPSCFRSLDTWRHLGQFELHVYFCGSLCLWHNPLNKDLGNLHSKFDINCSTQFSFRASDSSLKKTRRIWLDHLRDACYSGSLCICECVEKETEASRCFEEFLDVILLVKP